MNAKAAKPQEVAAGILSDLRKCAVKHGFCKVEFGSMAIQYATIGGIQKLRMNDRPETYDFAWRRLARWCLSNPEKAKIQSDNLAALAA